jgi:MFS family permease
VTAPADAIRPRGLRRLAALEPLWDSGVYRVLFVSQLIGLFGRWMHLVSAQWFLVGESAAMVALVPTAMSIPLVLFSILAGAWADMSDRRRMLLMTQAGLTVTAGLLAVLMFTSVATPWVVLALVFAMGVWTALNIPPFQSLQADSVPRDQLVQAATLIAVGANIGRAVGPALAGVAIVAAGVGGGFVFAAAAYALSWYFTLRISSGRKREPSKERLGAALRSGGQFVRESTSVKQLLFWTVVFVSANAAIWALLPKIAVTRLDLGASGYGLLLGSVGFGAVLGAFAMPAARQRMSSTQMFGAGIVVIGLATIGVTVIPNAWVVGALLVPLGAAYISVIAQTNGTLNLVLPDWVRARGLAFFVVTFHVALGAASALWGLIANGIGATLTVAISGALLLAFAPLLRWIGIPAAAAAAEIELTAWSEPELAPELDGPARRA